MSTSLHDRFMSAWHNLVSHIHMPTSDEKNAAIQEMDTVVKAISENSAAVEALSVAVGHPEVAAVVAKVDAVATLADDAVHSENVVKQVEDVQKIADTVKEPTAG